MIKKSKEIMACVDRVVNDVVVVVIRHPDAGYMEHDTFKEIYLRGARFKRLPKEGDMIPVDLEREDVITISVGNKIFCEVEFSLFGMKNQTITKKYQKSCRLSGLYDNPADDSAVRKARKFFWDKCRKDRESLEKKNPDATVFISKSSYWTDKYSDKHIFSEYARHVGYGGIMNPSELSGNSGEIPNSF